MSSASQEARRRPAAGRAGASCPTPATCPSARRRSCGSRRRGTPRGPARACPRRSPGLVVVDQLGVLRDDPVPLGLDRLDRPGERLAAAELGDVGLDEVHRDVRVLGPDLVGVVEAGARREVEPGVVRLVPCSPTSCRCRRRPSLRRLGGVAGDPSPTPRSMASWASFFSSSSGRNRSTSMPATILAIAWSGIEGHRLLAEAEEVEVRRVAQVEELEVVGPQLAVSCTSLLYSDIISCPLPMPRPSVMTAMSSRSGSGWKSIASSSAMTPLILSIQASYSVGPVGEVVAGPLGELRHPGLDLGRIGDPTGERYMWPLR